ncbi:ester cyclase [Thalassotalea euphylliae]|uniref:ester cyclase n=1 Tax=Thalassotalea euphylliae TaxID=1655234 RepID=UPI0015F257C8|nr:ester cyclase [Thalassotalea euphylliae]
MTKKFICIFTLFICVLNMTYAGAADMTRKERLVAFYDAFGKGDVEKLDKIIVEDWVTHDPNPGQLTGRSGFKQFIPLVHESISDLNWKIEEMIEEGNTIVVRSTFSGTHTGPLLGVEGTGKQFVAKAIDVHHFNDDGMVFETYHLEDWIAFLAQVGAIGH